MLCKLGYRVFLNQRCVPTGLTRGCPGGRALVRPTYKSSRPRHWKWSGATPHHTRSWEYGQLTSGLKTDWKDIADWMVNDHAIGTPLPYSGVVAYLQVNCWRRFLGITWSSFPPVGPTPDHLLYIDITATGQPLPSATMFLSES